MDIKELKSGQGNIHIIATIKRKFPSRQVNLKSGEQAEVCDAIISDGTGEIILSLWNDDIDRAKEGDKISINNGYVSTFQDQLQLTTGRYGYFLVVETQGTLPTK